MKEHSSLNISGGGDMFTTTLSTSSGQMTIGSGTSISRLTPSKNMTSDKVITLPDISNLSKGEITYADNSWLVYSDSSVWSSALTIGPESYIKIPDCKEGQILISNKEGELRCKDPQPYVAYDNLTNQLKIYDGRSWISVPNVHIGDKEIPTMTANLGWTNWLLIILAIIVISKISLKAWFSMVKFFGRKVDKVVKDVEKEWEEAE